MALPDFQSFFRPVLEVISDGNVWSLASIRSAVAVHLGVSDVDREVLISSGTRQFDGRVAWAVTYLSQAQAVRRVGRGLIEITDRGREVLVSGPARIDVRFLDQFPEFAEFRERTRTSSRGATGERATGTQVDDEAVTDPHEQISRGVDEINAAVAAEVVERIKGKPPEYLERIILDLMLAMGYGAIVGRAEHLGGSGDEGFDGVIHQDALGRERVYLQAKRYSENGVGRPAIQAFAGALQGAGATRGVFITTSRFTADAREFADRIPARVVLIDGPELGRLLVRYRVGVQVKDTFDVVAVDDDTFES